MSTAVSCLIAVNILVTYYNNDINRLLEIRVKYNYLYISVVLFTACFEYIDETYLFLKFVILFQVLLIKVFI